MGWFGCGGFFVGGGRDKHVWKDWSLLHETLFWLWQHWLTPPINAKLVLKAFQSFLFKKLIYIVKKNNDSSTNCSEGNPQIPSGLQQLPTKDSLVLSGKTTHVISASHLQPKFKFTSIYSKPVQTCSRFRTNELVSSRVLVSSTLVIWRYIVWICLYYSRTILTFYSLRGMKQGVKYTDCPHTHALKN